MERMETASPRNNLGMAANGMLEFYTVSQLAKLLQLTPMTIYRMVQRGSLPCHSIGRVKRFRRDDVELFLKQSRVPGRSGAVRDEEHTRN